MGPLVVEPVLVTNQFTEKPIATQRYQNVTDALGLKRQYEAFDDSDAPVLADLAVTWRLDPFAFDPASERVTVEDAVSVADDVLRLPVPTDGSSQERTELLLRGMVGERSDPHHTAAEVIHNDANPPTKWALLRYRQRQPRNPEAQTGGHGRQVDMPDIVGVLCGYDPSRGLCAPFRSWFRRRIFTKHPV